MANVIGLDHLNMTVNNLDKTTKFYKDLFGLEEKERGVWNGIPWRIIGKENTIYMAMYEKKLELKESRFSHIGFNIENFSEFKNQLVSENIDFEEIEYPKSISLYVKDPDGLEIEVSQKFGGGLH